MKLKKSLSRILVIAMLLQTFVSIGMQQSVFAATVALPLVNSMTYSADLDCFIAVGSTNSTHTTSAIMTSTDGLNWTARSGGPAIAIGLGSYNGTPTLSQGLVWGNNQVVALQKLNTGGQVLVTNSDISNWGVYPTTNTLGTTIYLGAITWDAASQKYYAVESLTNNDSIYYATDPTATNAWTKITLTTATSSLFMHIASNNNGTIAVSGAGGKTAIITAADSSATPAQSGGISATTVVPASINYDGKTDGAGKFIATKTRDAALYYLTGIGTTPVWTKINADAALPTGWTSASSYYAVAGNGADIIALPQGTAATTASAVAMSYVNQATITTTTVKPAIMDTTNLNNLFATSPVWNGGTNQTRFFGSAARPGGVIVAAMYKYASGTPGANSFIVIDNVESATTATATLRTPYSSSYASYDTTIVGNLDYTLNNGNPIYASVTSATYSISNTTVKDTARNTLTGKTINWSIPNAPTGVSVDSSTGAVTVTSSAPVNTTFVLQATSADQPSVVRKQTFTLQAAAPKATGVTINGNVANPQPGDTLTASYTYDDANSDVENGTVYRWLESSDPAFGSFSVAKEGVTTQATAGTNTAYLITSSDVNKYIKLEITPKNLVTPTTGTAVQSNSTAMVIQLLNEDFESFTTSSTLSQMQVYANVSENTGGKDYATNAALYDSGSNKALKFTYRNANGTGAGTGVPLGNEYIQRNWTPISGIAVMEARVKFNATANNYALRFLYSKDLVEFGLDGVYAYNDTTKGNKLKSTIGGATDFSVAQDKWYELKVVINTTTTEISGYAAQSFDFYVDGIKLVNQNKLNSYATTDYTTLGASMRMITKMAYSGTGYPATSQGDIYFDNWVTYSIDSAHITALNSALSAETSANNAAVSKGNTFAAFEAIRGARTLVSQLPVDTYAQINLNNDIYRSTATCLASEMNLTNIPQEYMSIPGASDLNGTFSKADYTGFLKAYSKYLINKIRGISFGNFSWHAAQIGSGKMTVADIMITNGGTGYISDKYSINGDPSQTHNMQWVLSGTSDPSLGGDYSTFYNFIPLVAAYWSKGNEIYKDKWFEISNNFECNQYNQVQNSTLTDSVGKLIKDSRSYSCNWRSDNAGSALSQGMRTEGIIKSLAVIAKSLTPQKITDWNNVFDVCSDTLTQEQLDSVPFLELTNIVTSLVNQYPPALIDRYTAAGAVPNQRLAGLEGLAMISRVFDEFNDTVTTTSTSASTGLTDYADTMFYKDGAMLEQSFNYNFSDKAKVDNLNCIYQNVTVKPAWLSSFNVAIDNFIKMVNGFANPLGQLPRLASFTPSQSPAIWLNPSSISTWTATANNSGIEFLPSSTPAYTSVAFPYEGYYAMRSGWDMQNDIYLAFINAPRARGHKSPNSNAVDITAYGRKMIVSGGTPWYSTSYAPESQVAEFDQFDKYFGEQSSYKNSTVLVNDKNQSGYYKSYNNLLQAVSTNIIPNRWHSSDHFDFTEGLWDGGYNLDGTIYESHIDSSVTHQRQVLFVKDAKMWILNDTMHANTVNSTAYSQVWNFSPYDTGNNPGVGYSQNQVVCDQANNTIYTSDTSGPNLWMYNFAGKAFTYAPYYGYKGSPQYIGWYSPGFNGAKTEKVDVHVKWTDPAIVNIADRTDKAMVTAIIPTTNATSKILYKTDLSSTQNGGESGFELKTTDNITVSYLTSPVVKTLTLQGISANAKLLSVTKKDSETVYRGVVLGNTSYSLTINGVANSVAYMDYEFVVSNGTLTVTPIKIPTYFLWENDVPSYSDTQAPTAPTGLSSSNVTGTHADLSWVASSDNIAVTGYDIYKDGTLIGSTTGSANYSVSGLSPLATYSFTVKAKDAVNNISASSTALSVTTISFFSDNFEGYTDGTTNGVTTGTAVKVGNWTIANKSPINTLTITNGDGSNTSKFMSSTDATNTFTATSNNNGIVVVDARVKTTASGGSWLYTKTSTNKSLTALFISSGNMGYTYGTGTTNSSGGIILAPPSGTYLYNGTTLTPSTWYYVRQVMDFSSTPKKVTLYYGTSLSNLQVWKTDVATSTVDLGYSGTSPNFVAPPDISSVRCTGTATVDEIIVYN